MNKEELKASGRMIFECVAGSHAYGNHTPQSDIDLRGVYMLPPSEYMSLDGFQDCVKPIKIEEGDDYEYMEFKKFYLLLMNCSPNVIEYLFMPEDCVRITSLEMKFLVDNRSMFITKRAKHSFSGFAHAQIKRARGQNKWINNPQPKERPDKLDFCWIIDMVDLKSHDEWHEYGRFDTRYAKPGEEYEDNHGFPFRPQKLKDTNIDISKYHASSMEHVPNMYRLYHYGDSSRGVFRGEDQQLNTESIPKEDEWLCFQYAMVFNEPAYESAKRDHENYWEWRENRNEERWETQENGTLDYDSKNMSHCIRLMKSGVNVLRNGEPIVRLTGDDLKLVRDIRSGEYSYDEIMAMAAKEESLMEELYVTSSIPHSIDEDMVRELYNKIIKMRFGL